MRKILLAAALLLLCTAIKAQKCEFEYNEVDEFTKAVKIKTKMLKLTEGLKEKAFFTLRKVNDTYLIDLAYAPAPRAAIIREGSQLMIKLNNGEILTIEAYKTAISKTAYYQGYASTSIEAVYKISKEELNKISEYKIDKFRIYYTETYDEPIVSEKGNKLLIQAINCITQ